MHCIFYGENNKQCYIFVDPTAVHNLVKQNEKQHTFAIIRNEFSDNKI